MKRLFIVTGDMSSDLHCSFVVERLLKSSKDWIIEAVGGENLRKTGINIFCDHKSLNAVGLNFDIVFKHFILGKKIVSYLKNDYKPDLVLLCDYGGFNLMLAKYLKNLGIKIFYFIPPQIWASRPWRINTIKKYIDKVLTIFPFEQKMYEKHGINSYFVGNPLAVELKYFKEKDRKDFFEENNLDSKKKLISIFPGSRKFEIKYLLKTFLETKEYIKQNIKNPDSVQFVLCQAKNIDEKYLRKYICNDKILILKNCNYELLSFSDVLILASGTVALEAALYRTPMVVSYRGPEFFYIIYLLVRCIKNVSLPNIILGKQVISEMIQNKARADFLGKEVIKIITDDKYRLGIVSNLGRMKEMLSEKNYIEEVVNQILSI